MAAAYAEGQPSGRPATPRRDGRARRSDLLARTGRSLAVSAGLFPVVRHDEDGAGRRPATFQLRQHAASQAARCEDGDWRRDRPALEASRSPTAAHTRRSVGVAMGSGQGGTGDTGRLSRCVRVDDHLHDPQAVPRRAGSAGWESLVLLGLSSQCRIDPEGAERRRND